MRESSALPYVVTTPYSALRPTTRVGAGSTHGSLSHRGLIRTSSALDASAPLWAWDYARSRFGMRSELNLRALGVTPEMSGAAGMRTPDPTADRHIAPS